MDDLHTNSPADYNLFLAAEALQGILEAIYELTAEIPSEGEALSHWTASLTGLVWAGKRIATENRIFLHVASDMNRFPNTYESLDSEYMQSG